MPPEAVFEPPFDCRQYRARRASVWRGRFQPIRSRASANPMLRILASKWWASRRYWPSSGAVHTVEL